MVTVYSVSSQSGSVNRTPTLRPDVSTTNGVAGVIVTCDGSTSASDCVVVTIRRDPDAAAAAAGSTDVSVTRGPCATLAAAPASPSTASSPTTMPNVATNARLRRRPRPRTARWRRQYSYGSSGSAISSTAAASTTRRPSDDERTVPVIVTHCPVSGDATAPTIGQARRLRVDHAVRDDEARQVEGAVGRAGVRRGDEAGELDRVAVERLGIGRRREHRRPVADAERRGVAGRGQLHGVGAAEERASPRRRATWRARPTATPAAAPASARPRRRPRPRRARWPRPPRGGGRRGRGHRWRSRSAHESADSSAPTGSRATSGADSASCGVRVTVVVAVVGLGAERQRERRHGADEHQHGHRDREPRRVGVDVQRRAGR